MAALEGDVHNGWMPDTHDGSMVETTSSEDELLSPTPEGLKRNVKTS